MKPRFLLATLSLSFCLCLPVPGNGQAPHEPGLRAGAALANITPKLGVPLDGTISQNGPAMDVHDELHARCLVLDDGSTRLAFAVVDSTVISREVIDQAKRLVETRLGIPPSHVCISATHTHSSPRAMVGLSDEASHREYLDFLAIRIADGIQVAANQLESAAMGWSSFEEPRFVHNRRWFVTEDAPRKNPFGAEGESVVMNPGRNGLVKPAGPVDTEVYLLSVRGPAGAPRCVLSAYGLHYVGGIPRGTISADYYGVYAAHLGELLQAGRQDPAFVGIMANGTSGDINANDYSQPAEKAPAFERMEMVGRSLAKKAAKTLDTLTHQEQITLAAAATELELAVRKPDEKRLAWAREMQAPKNQTKTLSRGQVYARETLCLADYPDTVRIPIQVFRLGDLAIAQIPCEVFAETGLAIKERSPFRDTFTIELANGYYGYLPARRHFDLGGYETWPARSSFLEEQAEPKIVEAILELMHQLSLKEENKAAAQ